MSKTIDERVVSMEFDNSRFERNVATSMSTLDKLKQKLNLSGASKGLENLNSSAKRVNMSVLGNAVDTVHAKFSALEVMGVTALANITNSAVNAGKRMVSALTIDPVKTGFREYETQINAIQTILSNTRQEGTNVKIVNKALDELNEYADRTIYNFTEMTRNIGTFTAAGVKLDTSVNAIKGIANLAAVSGSTSQQASTAMYQLSQALAAGKVQLMDWNSVVNAGMGGKLFQDALVRTSELLGTGAKAAIKAEGSFRESLTKTGWLTTEVLTETLNQLAGAYDKADLMAQGFTESQANEILALAKDAESAAQDVKTFTQLWDVMKESAQSGWSRTWRTIIGDFEEAKSLLTKISEVFTGDNGLITRMSDWRNDLLESALGQGFTKLSENINNVLEPAKKMTESVKEVGDTVGKVTSTIGDLGTIVDDVILGKFGNGRERFDKLAESGQNFYRVQNKVNEKLGDSFRYTDQQIEAQDKLLASQKKTTESTKESKEETVNLTDAQKKQLIQLSKLSDEQLKAKGYTDEQIASLRELQKTAEKLGIPFDTFINKLDEINGRWLLINSFKNIGSALGKVFTSLGKAWRDVFDPIKPEQIFNVIAAFHKFTSSLIMNKDTSEDLRRTFKGLFAALDIVSTFAGGALKFAFKALTKILGAFDMDILDLTGNIGDAIIKFRDWLFEQNSVAKTIDGLIDKLPQAIDRIEEWFNAFKETPAVNNFVEAIEIISDAFSKLFNGEIDSSELARSLGTGLANVIKAIPDIAVQIGKDFIAGFQNGIDFNFPDIVDKIVSFCLSFIDAFKEALGVHSPSWKAYDIAVDFFQGAINGIKDSLEFVIKAIKFIGEQIVKQFKSFWEFITDENGDLEWDKIFTGGILISSVMFLKRIGEAFGNISEAFSGFGDLLTNAGKVLKSFSKVLKSYAWDIKAKALLKLATSLAILVAALWVLTTIDDPAMLWTAVGVIAALSVILIGLAFAMDKISKTSARIDRNGFNVDGLKTGLMQIGMTLLLLAVVLKIVGDMTPKKAKQGFVGLVGLAVGMVAFLAAMGAISIYAKNVEGIGKTMLKLSIAMLLMVGVIKIISTLSSEDAAKGIAFAVAFSLFVGVLIAVTRGAGNNVSKVGGMMIKLSIAMGLMVGAVKMISMLSAEEMLKGAAFAIGFAIFVKLLVSATKIGDGQKLAKVGGMLMSISFSLLLMVGVCKLVDNLSIGEITKGAAFVGGFIVLLKLLVKILTISDQQQMANVAGTILAMSAAIAILAGVAIILSYMDIRGLAKGIVAVGLLSTMMMFMVKTLKGAQNVKGAIMMMAISIGIMAGSIALLSFIEPEKLIAPALALSMLMGIFTLMIKFSHGIRTSIESISLLILAVTGLAAILGLLMELDSGTGRPLEIAKSLGVLMLSMAATFKIINGTHGVSLGAIAAMGAMVIILGGVALVLGLMSHFNVSPSIETAASLSILLLTMAGVTAVLTLVGAAAPAALAGIAVFALVVAGVGALLVALGALNEYCPGVIELLDSGIPVLEKIGAAIGKFVGSIIGSIGEGVMDSVIQMTKQFNVVMRNLSEASEVAATIKPESFNGVMRLIGALSLIGLTTVGTSISDIFTLGGTSMEKFQTDGVAFFNAMHAIAKASSGINIDEVAMDAVISVAEQLADLQSSLEPIGGVISWFRGRDDLAAFGVNVGEFIGSMKTALASLNDDVSLNKEALSAIIQASAELADLQSVLEPIGGVIGWFRGRDDLAAFGVNVGEFIGSMKVAMASLTGITVNEEALSAVITASSKLSGLQSVLEPIGGVISWFRGRDDLAAFGVNVGEFIGSMKTALASLNDDVSLNEDALASVITASSKLAGLQSSLEPMGGVISWFSGRTDLGTFGVNVGLFADAMGKLKTGMGEDGITEAAIISITNAGEAVIALQKALPEEHWFDGKMNLSEFSDYVTDFGTAMSGFGEAASSIDSDAVSKTVSTAFRIKNLITSLVGLDTSGLKVFTGIGTGGFGADGAAYKIAQAISSYSTEVSGIDTNAVSVSVSAAIKLKGLISGLVGLDASGVKNFKPDSIATSMKSYANKVKGIDSGAVSTSISSANRLKNFISGLTGLDPSGISNFRLGSIGNSLKSYAASVSGFDVMAVSSSISMANRLRNFISSLSGLSSGGVDSFVTAVNKLGTVSVDNIIKAFSGASTKMFNAGSNLIESVAKGIKSKQSSLNGVVTNLVSASRRAIMSKESSFASAGATLMVKMVSGITSKRSSVASSIGSAISLAVAQIRGYYSSFSSAGSYLGSGLVNGINSKQSAVYRAGYALGQKAVQGEKDGQKSHSPSKLTIQSGKWLGEGLIIGIRKMDRSVYNAGYEIGDTATSSLSKAITKMSEAINLDIDAQPRIRPVLDLTDVHSGAGMISDIFNRRFTIGATANAKMVNSLMNERIQNGENDDIVSAINKLRKDIGNIGGTTNYINGITYDDGSGLSDAIATIVRAARLERRT